LVHRASDDRHSSRRSDDALEQLAGSAAATRIFRSIVALAEATLLLSVWAGCQYYTLYSRDLGFFGCLITSAMAAIALGRDSQRIAVLCLIGAV